MVASAPAYRASDGAAYDRFLGRWSRRLAGPFIDFARLPPYGPVLDVGCGTGSLAAMLTVRAPERTIVGADLSPSYLEQARRNAPNGLYTAADAGRLALRDMAFAASLAQLVLNFVPDPAVAVAEMRRVTRLGGTVAASVWDFRGGLVYQRLFWDTAACIDEGAARARDRPFATPLATADGLVRLWTEAGLTEVATEPITIRMDYESFEDYWQPLLGGRGPVGVYVTGLDDSRRALVRERVRLAYLAGGGDGVRSMAATAWAVRGIVG